jgi:Kef-type K+ transport system membrane component KefB
MPRSPDGAADAELLHSVEKASSALLPVFFVVTGLSVRIGALDGRDWALFAVICALAVAGKLGGSAAAARMSRMPWRESVIVGALMNTRGLTELIAIDASRAAGLISGEMYTILVLMALVTTALTGPLLTLVRASALPRTTVGAYAAARALASPEAAAGRDSATIPAA